MSLTIFGLGTALPEYHVAQAEAAALAEQLCCQTEEQATLLRALFRRSGVNNRHVALPHQTAYDWNEPEPGYEGTTRVMTKGPTTQQRMQWYAELAPPLALAAAREALERSERSARDITHLITVSCTGFVAPGLDVHLIGKLGLQPTVERTHVGFMGCHGAINGLRVARSFVEAEPKAQVLLCAVELCSLHFCSYWEPSRFVGNAIFADGAAALVGGRSDATEEWRVAACGSSLIPDSTDAMSWIIGDYGFEMVLSPRVPELIQNNLRPWLEAWLGQNRLTIQDIASWAIHPGGPRILRAVEDSLGLERAATAVSRSVLSECGNMSSPTVLFILDRLRRADAPRPCVALGFGPGLVAEATLFV